MRKLRRLTVRTCRSKYQQLELCAAMPSAPVTNSDSDSKSLSRSDTSSVRFGIAIYLTAISLMSGVDFHATLGSVRHSHT